MADRPSWKQRDGWKPDHSAGLRWRARRRSTLFRNPSPSHWRELRRWIRHSRSADRPGCCRRRASLRKRPCPARDKTAGGCVGQASAWNGRVDLGPSSRNRGNLCRWVGCADNESARRAPDDQDGRLCAGVSPRSAVQGRGGRSCWLAGGRGGDRPKDPLADASPVRI